MPRNPEVDKICGKSKISVDDCISPADYRGRRGAKLSKKTNPFAPLIDAIRNVWDKFITWLKEDSFLSFFFTDDASIPNYLIFFVTRAILLSTILGCIAGVYQIVYFEHSLLYLLLIPVLFIMLLPILSILLFIPLGLSAFVLFPILFPPFAYFLLRKETQKAIRETIKKAKADERESQRESKFYEDCNTYTSRFKAEAEVLSSRYLSSAIVANIVEAILSRCIEAGALYTALSRKIYIDVRRDKVSYGVDKEGERTFDFNENNCALLPNPLTATALAIALFKKLADKIADYEPKLELSSALEMLDVGASYHAKLTAKTGEKKTPEADAAEAAQGATA